MVPGTLVGIIREDSRSAAAAGVRTHPGVLLTSVNASAAMGKAVADDILTDTLFCLYHPPMTA